MPETQTRPMRLCDACGQVDDHPRHVIAHAPGDGVTTTDVASAAIAAASDADRPAIIAQARDTSTIMRHMDCCRAAGCPDGTCNIVTAGAEDKKGDALVKHLTSRKPATSREG